MIKQRMFTPGPTDVPPEVLNEMALPIFHHRTEQFRKMFGQVNESLKKLLFTRNDVLTLSGSGTAAMESAIATLVPRGKKVLVANGGKFGERWAKVARVYGFDVDELKQEWGTAISPQEVKAKISSGGYAAAVITHSETSTATAADIKGIAEVTRNTETLLLVDAITSAGALPLKQDEWGIDVIGIGSQKALMLPPGLAFVSVSEKAWKAAEQVKGAPVFYLNLKAYRKSLADSDVPYTPAITLIRGLQKSLSMIEAVGIEKLWTRIAVLAKATRTGCEAMGLKVYSRRPSDSVTAIWYPEGVDDTFRKKIKSKYGCNVAGGQDDITGKVFRVNHMGWTDPLDTLGLIAAVEYTLADLGAKVQIGKGLAAAANVLKEWQ